MKKASAISFVEKAGKGAGRYPWNDEHVRQDVQKLVSLRLTEPEYLKIKFICEQDNISQQKVIHNLVKAYIDTRVTELVST